MKIRSATASDFQLWDAYVHRHSEASPYHLIGWKQAVEKAYGHQSCYLVAEQDGLLVGVLPLIRIKSPLGKDLLCGLPFCDVGQPLADTGAIKEQLELAAQGLRAENLELRDFSRSEPSDYSGKVRMLLPLPESAEALWGSFKSKLRSQIRKAEKNGLTFSTSKTEDGVSAFYEVFAKNMRDLGSPVHALRWFSELQKAYGHNMEIGLVFKDETVVGAGILLFAGNKVSIPWASTLREYNKLAPNMLLYWNLLRISCERRCTEFDFGRSTFNEGTYKFKSQWGALPVELEWKSPVNGTLKSIEQASSKKPGRVRVLIENAWRKLPLGLTIQLGPAIRKYISL